MKIKNKKAAFSLIELSVAMVVLSILVAGLLSTTVSDDINKKNKITQERIKVIYKALGGYLAKNHKLPCPAPVDDSVYDSSYGDASVVTSGNCSTDAYIYKTAINKVGSFGNIVYGMVPVKTLGLRNEYAADAWGGKFSYIIDERFTSNHYFDGTINFGDYDITPSIDIGSTDNGGISDAVFAIISHGANQYGAYSQYSSTQNDRSLATTDEKDNDYDDSDFDLNLILRSSNAGFDDIVFYKNRKQIVSDYNLMFLMSCSFFGSLDASTSHHYGSISYANGECSTNTHKTARLCGPWGIWDTAVSCGEL